MSSAAWRQMYESVIVEALESVLWADYLDYFDDGDGGRDMKLVWRTTPSQLNQDGYDLSEHTQHSDSDSDSAIPPKTEDKNTPVIITKNSIRYRTFPFNPSSLKTGFYVDQR